jgi:hypothetical protein
MHGFQAFENNKPRYCIGRIADGRQPPPPESFDQTWKKVVLLLLYDLAGHGVFILTSQSRGGRDAVVNLIDAMSDVCAGHPEDVGKLPICELASDSYNNSVRKHIFFPIFETVGFAERPEEVRRIKPSPPEALAIEHKSEIPAATPTPETTSSPKTTSAADMNDEIPF